MFSPLSKIVLCLDMLFGRLEIFPMLYVLMPSTWRSSWRPMRRKHL
jgi:trk system potassium uptake protein TrkH